MLVIGSRAIRHHFPGFRSPLDWDLIGTDEEIARLDGLLPRITPPGVSPEKPCYSYQGVPVEVVRTSEVSYWDAAVRAFAGAPTLTDPILGALAIPPPGYLLLTKQCGLIYPMLYWHKNLEDLYFLRDRVATIPEEIAALVPGLLHDFREIFAATSAGTALVPAPCHPATRGPGDPALHRRLHDRLAIESLPAVDEARAWEGFPERAGASKRARLIDLFAEETMVLGAEQSRVPVAEGEARGEAELQRWAIRMLITGGLPEGLRYFGVNYYREILARVPRGWLARSADPAPSPPEKDGS